MEALQIIIWYEKTQNFFDKGFETIGMSKEIHDDEKEEIEDNFKSALPSILQGTSDVPAFFFKSLRSGRYLMCKVSLGGDNESYICHGLIMRDSGFPLHPALLMNSPVFEHDFQIEQKQYMDLPALTELTAGEIMDYKNISSFIKQRIDLGFGDMVSGILSFGKTHTPLSIYDEQRNIFYWIAALQMVFPVEMSHNISFTTCPFEDGGFMIEAQSLVSSPANQDDRRFIFDYRRGIRCDFKTLPNFLKIINTGLTVSKAILDTFHRFLNSFNYKELTWDMEGCYSLFLLNSFKGLNITCEDIKSAFMFANLYTPEEMLEDVFRMIEPSMSKVVEVSDLEAAKVSVEFIFKAALSSNKVVFVERACYYLNSFIDHLVLNSNNPDIEGAAELYTLISVLSTGKNNMMFKNCLLDDRINYINKRLEENGSPGKARFYLYIALGSAIELGYYWNQMLHTENLRLFIDSCINLISDSIENMLPVIEIVSANNEFLIKTVVLFYNRIKSANIMKGFIEQLITIIDSKDEKERLSIRREISSQGCIRLLFDEYTERLSGTQDIIDLFDDYQKNVFGQINEFYRQYFSEAVKMYVQKLPFEYTGTESLKLIREIARNGFVLEDTALSILINAFEDSVTIIPPGPDVREIILTLKQIKKNRGVVTKPNITAMVDFGIWLESCGPSHTMEDIFGEPLEIELLDEKRYPGLIGWYLPNVIGFASSPEDYKRLMHFLGKEDMDLELHLACLRSLDDFLIHDTAKGANLLLQFSVYYFFYLEPRCKLIGDDALLENIRLSLQDILSKQSKDLLARLNYDIKKEFENRRLSLPIQWGLIYNEVMGKGSSHTSKGLLSFFKKK